MIKVFGLCLSMSFCSFLVWAGEDTDPMEDFSPLKENTFHFLSSITSQNLLQDLPLWRNNSYSLKRFLVKKEKNAIVHGHVDEPSLRWEWGFRNGIKYHDPHEEWHVAGSYAHYHSRSYRSIKKEEGFMPVWESFRTSLPGDTKDPTWRLDVDFADIETARAYVMRKFLSIRPHVGMRTARVYQKFSAPDESLLKEPTLGSTCLAIGGRGGVDTSWKMGRGLGIFVDSALSLLLTRNRLSPDLFLPMQSLEYCLGLQYEKKWTKPLTFLLVRIGYECNSLFPFSEHEETSWIDGSYHRPQEKIVLEGLSLGFHLDF